MQTKYDLSVLQMILLYGNETEYAKVLVGRSAYPQDPHRNLTLLPGTS